MVRILYVHGYNGKENGKSSLLLKEALDRSGIEYSLISPAFNLLDSDSMQNQIKSYGEFDVVVASSLGAFYAMQSDVKAKILINPALYRNVKHISKDDGCSDITDSFLDSMKSMENLFFSNEVHRDDTYFVFGSRDNIAPNKEIFYSVYGTYNTRTVDFMGHCADENGMNTVVDIICSKVIKCNQS